MTSDPRRRLQFWDRKSVPKLDPFCAPNQARADGGTRNDPKRGPSFGPGKRSQNWDRLVGLVKKTGPFSGPKTGATFLAVFVLPEFLFRRDGEGRSQLWDRKTVPKQAPAGLAYHAEVTRPAPRQETQYVCGAGTPGLVRVPTRRRHASSSMLCGWARSLKEEMCCVSTVPRQVRFEAWQCRSGCSSLAADEAVQSSFQPVRQRAAPGLAWLSSATTEAFSRRTHMVLWGNTKVLRRQVVRAVGSRLLDNVFLAR